MKSYDIRSYKQKNWNESYSFCVFTQCHHDRRYRLLLKHAHVSARRHVVLLANRTATQYMIGYWHHHVVCPSVCPSVTLCIVALQGRCTGPTYRVNTCTSVPCFSRQVPICPFKHFCCRMYHLATKRAGKKRVEENANPSFFETHNQACTASMVMYIFCYSLHLVNFAQSRCPVAIRRLQVGAFTNCSLSERIRLYTSRTYVRRRPKLVTKTCLTARQFMNVWLRILYLVLLL